MTVRLIPDKIIKKQIKYYIEGKYGKKTWLPLGECESISECKKTISKGLDRHKSKYRIIKETIISEVIKNE